MLTYSYRILRRRWRDIESDITGNVILALIGGAIGSSVTILWVQIKERSDGINTKDRVRWPVVWRYLCLGAISGFVAVNLLNQSGSLSEKIPLAILAGLSPVSYLRGQALTDGSEEHNSLTKNKKVVSEYLKTFEDEYDVENPKDVVKKLQSEYNIIKGDDEND